jgi:uncharacterized membrane protein
MPLEPQDLLIADLEHFGESAWRNEEVGEKRFNFFVTLLTAAVAGLIALATEGDVTEEEFRTIAAVSSGFLLAVGLLSQARFVHRNRVTAEYHATLAYIREVYKTECPALRGYDVPCHMKKTWARKWLRGGYVEMMTTLNGIILIALLILVNLMVPVAIALGVAYVLLFWIISHGRDGRDKNGEPVLPL